MQQPPDETLPPPTGPALVAISAALVGTLVLQLGLVAPAALRAALGFAPDGFPAAWWTPLTYPLVAASPVALALDLAALWLFGPRLETLWGARRFALFALLCAIGGALLRALIGGDALLLGATAVALGVMLAHVRQWPGGAVWLFGVAPLRARPMAVALTAVVLVAGVGVLDAPGAAPDFTALAHLGGAATAWLFLRVPQRDRIEQLRQRISPVPDTSDDIVRPIPRTPPRPRERPDEVDDVVARSKAALARRRDPAPRVRRSAPTPRPVSHQDELDRVLDKISRSGMESLSAEEREVLARSARRLKGSE